MTQVEPPAISSYELSHGLLGEALESRPPVISYLSQGLTAADALDPRTGIPLSAGIPVAGDPFVVADEPSPVRPDDRADRFVVGDGTPAAPVTDSDGFTVDWANGVTLGIGALALVLALGLAGAYLRRPRIVL